MLQQFFTSTKVCYYRCYYSYKILLPAQLVSPNVRVTTFHLVTHILAYGNN
jgi:hypothetical protein